jgi:regulator of protease activity HflC (stomatin/prohibitin superfamily)
MFTQHVITKDNVSIAVDGAITIRVVNTWKSCYCAANPAEMLVAIANGIIRKVVGTMNVDDLYHNRDLINKAVFFRAFETSRCCYR